MKRELADKVDAYPEFEPMVKSSLAIAQGVAKPWRQALVPMVEVPPYPRQNHAMGNHHIKTHGGPNLTIFIAIFEGPVKPHCLYRVKTT